MLSESQAGTNTTAIQNTTRNKENTTKISKNENMDKNSEIEVICEIMLCITKSETIHFRIIMEIFQMER